MDKVKQQIHYWCKGTMEEQTLGDSITSAVLDTGLYPHPDFAGRVLGFHDFINGRTGIYDDSGHGTHVAGILAGSGKMSGGILSGIAPESNLVILKVLDEKGEGDVQHMVAGMEWILRNREKYRIRIVNLSAGAKEDISIEKKKMLLGAVEQLWEYGITVAASSGNAIQKEIITVPGTSSKIITVGISDCRKENISRENKKEKPDVYAPGYQVISCNAMSKKMQMPYTIKSGTSMATPVVSGIAALAMAQNPEISNEEIKKKLRNKPLNVAKILS